MLKLLQQNKSLAIIVVLVLVIILYLRFGRKDVATKEKASNKTTSKSRGARGARGSRNGGKGGGGGKGGKGGSDSRTEKASNRNAKGKGGGGGGAKGKGATKGKGSGKDDKGNNKPVDLHNDDDSSSASEDEDLREDAEELYNLVHEGMCSGMQQSEFEQAVDDLADAFIFIELKQLYNQCIDKNMDPEKAITINDYIRVLKREE